MVARVGRVALRFACGEILRISFHCGVFKEKDPLFFPPISVTFSGCLGRALRIRFPHGFRHCVPAPWGVTQSRLITGLVTTYARNTHNRRAGDPNPMRVGDAGFLCGFLGSVRYSGRLGSCAAFGGLYVTLVGFPLPPPPCLG